MDRMDLEENDGEVNNHPGMRGISPPPTGDQPNTAAPSVTIALDIDETMEDKE
jgi:hypothetical protein